MSTMEIDPVCEKHLEPKDAAAQTTIHGNTYYFCSQACKVKFELALNITLMRIGAQKNTSTNQKLRHLRYPPALNHP